MQPPDDGHGALPGMAHIRGGAEEGEGGGAAPGVFVRWTDEKHHVTTAFRMVDVALTSLVPLAGLRLRLPVEEVRGDRVIAVAGAGRVVLLALFERDEEVVSVRLRMPERT